MIKADEIVEIGKFGKPHGTRGEINAYLDENVDAEAIERFALDIDGILVPFFLESNRPKRQDTFIWKIEGVDSEEAASQLTHAVIYAFKDDDVVTEEERDDDGLYASDLVGYTLVHANGVPVGTITAIEDSTENALFIVELPDGSTRYVPIANDLIDDIDTDRKYIVMTLPEGILEL